LIFLDNAIKYSPDGTRIHVTLEIPGGVIQARFKIKASEFHRSTYRSSLIGSTGPRL